MRTGHCCGCGQHVTVDSPPDGHTRAVPDARGEPIPVLCGPVDLDPEMNDDLEQTIRAAAEHLADQFATGIAADLASWPPFRQVIEALAAMADSYEVTQSQRDYTRAALDAITGAKEKAT